MLRRPPVPAPAFCAPAALTERRSRSASSMAKSCGVRWRMKLSSMTNLLRQSRLKVDLTAFEILRDVLADLVNRGPRNSAARFGTALVFGTITQGVASLPIDPSYLELGPIIDLDCLDWRSSRPAMGDTKLITLSATMARSLRAGLAGKSTDIEEAQRLVRSFISKRNPRIEHVVLSAYTALVACRKDKDMPTPLQSLVYGWLVPFWAAHGVAKSRYDSEVDGGKCDANLPDPG